MWTTLPGPIATSFTFTTAYIKVIFKSSSSERTKKDQKILQSYEKMTHAMQNDQVYSRGDSIIEHLFSNNRTIINKGNNPSKNTIRCKVIDSCTLMHKQAILYQLTCVERTSNVKPYTCIMFDLMRAKSLESGTRILIKPNTI